ncbi:MAG: TetR/AcrR family transcriptional regulator; helix-turn-helix transcriptional regulator [Butyrivibrio sp.]|nr:TetR/AcrR family transcriptional regulator; helix-turn-helix transcriptional regulator [Butyrivibrio sp.]
MPRDKTLSHIKVNKAIKEEFLEKGYEGASIRSIGARAGMTSAGLYRHYADKEAMFNAIVEPLVMDIKGWTSNHITKKHTLIDHAADNNDLWDDNILDMIREVIIPKRDVFKLLLICSKGTKYENFIREYAAESIEALLDAMTLMKKKGYDVADIDEEELRMMLSAYLTACFEPIINGCDEAQIDKYLNTIQEFFMPGWRRIMGLN